MEKIKKCQYQVFPISKLARVVFEKLFHQSDHHPDGEQGEGGSSSSCDGENNAPGVVADMGVVALKKSSKTKLFRKNKTTKSENSEVRVCFSFFLINV